MRPSGRSSCTARCRPLNDAYRAAGVALPPTRLAIEVDDRSELKRALVVAPPQRGRQPVDAPLSRPRATPSPAAGCSCAARVAGAAVDRGFVLSDHADWPGLQQAIAATGAERVIVTHGYEAVMVRWLHEQGLQAGSFRTEYGDEDIETEPVAS